MTVREMLEHDLTQGLTNTMVAASHFTNIGAGATYALLLNSGQEVYPESVGFALMAVNALTTAAFTQTNPKYQKGFGPIILSGLCGAALGLYEQGLGALAMHYLQDVEQFLNVVPGFF